MERIWQKSYPRRAHDIQLDGVSTMVTVVGQLPAYAGKTSYISMGKSISYAELDALTRDFAAWLHANGWARATASPDDAQPAAISCLPVRRLARRLRGQLQSAHTAHELEHQLADSGARAIVVADNFAHVAAGLPKSAIERVLVTSIGELLGPLKGRLVDLVVKRVKRMVPAGRFPARSGGPGARRPALHRGRAESGRPGLPAIHGRHHRRGQGGHAVHGNLMANVSQAPRLGEPLVRDGEELIVTALPLYHIFALTANCLTFMKIGASNLLIVNPRDIPGLIKEMSKAPVSAFTGSTRCSTRC